MLPRLRVVTGDEIALGPGKADLLALVGETGSIREAASRLDMSYMRAWKLIQTMNTCFRDPVVVTERGGHVRGGAKLTETGVKALSLYRQMEQTCLQNTEPDWKELSGLLR
ncbi:MAG TPA: LysR family transcriptional regulator [Candidatus Limnocylindria bacterium]|nr:LysR family transcriptional regulator [Candidatus Limnocylindria bacterium]